MEKDENISPILKWAGGKRQLLPEIMKLIPKKYSTYVEPFFGGGAVLFDLQPKRAIINDMNAELMNVYKVVKENPKELIKVLKVHDEKNNKEYFYETRGIDRTDMYEELSSIDRAARVIYLNKTCYNGLYRVNTLGQFNTPYGRHKNPKIVDDIAINAMSTYFNENNIEIQYGDYKKILKGLKKNDFVYLDPPYMTDTTQSFTGYTKYGFSKKDQDELKEECDKLREKGIFFIQSNSDCEYIRNLYKDYGMKIVKARRFIGGRTKSREEINEVLIYYNGEE